MADVLTGDDVLLIGLYATAPVLAALGAGWRGTAAIALAALVLAVISQGSNDSMGSGNELVLMLTVAVIGVIATSAAVVRTRREAAAVRASFLGHAGELLSSLEPREALARIAEDAVPAIADRCVLQAAESPSAAVTRRDRIVMPLVARERTLGVLELGLTGGGRRFGAEDHELAAELAGRCAVAIDNARLVAEAKEQTARYETLMLALSEVGEAMVVLDEGRLVYANPAFETISGYSGEELRGMESVFDLVIDEQRAPARRRAKLRLEGQVDPGYQLTICHRDGHRVPMEVAGVPLEVEGRRQLVVVARDVTARARAEEERGRLLQRAGFLAEASAVFDEVLDEERTLQSVARLSVRDLADTCVVLLGSSIAAIRRVAAVAHDPADEERLRELVESYPSFDRRSHPLIEALRTGKAQLVEHAMEVEQLAQDARHLELIRSFPMRSTIIVPLSARGRTLGAIALGFRQLAVAADVSLFEDLAGRAALAIDNARLYEERKAVARTLQHSLLPPDMPEVPGMQLAARYLAAGEGNEVGGDFYDCFPTGNGDWALVIGDVCGKGAEAAAVTALARYTVRASATMHTDRPRDVLLQLNEAIRLQTPDQRFCTVTYVSLSPHDHGVSACVATGGHPLPLLLRADGSVETAGRPGTLLGILTDPELSAEPVELAPGDTLILYTDGVIEASPLDDAFGPGPFADFVAGCAGRDAAVIARRIEEQVLAMQGGNTRDDVAIVVLRVSPRVDASHAPERPRAAATR